MDLLFSIFGAVLVGLAFLGAMMWFVRTGVNALIDYGQHGRPFPLGAVLTSALGLAAILSIGIWVVFMVGSHG